MAKKNLNILVTGADGFIGRNLCVRLSELPHICILPFVRGDSHEKLNELLRQSDAIIHLAGENRAEEAVNFYTNNTLLTEKLCQLIQDSDRNIPLIFTSSKQANNNTVYGQSKYLCEKAIEKLTSQTGNSAVIYRLPGVFGKWCKPNYNSVVATYCYNVINDLPIKIDDHLKKIDLVYIDDVIRVLINSLGERRAGLYWGEVEPIYQVSLKQLSQYILSFKQSRTNLVTEKVGVGFLRALYATYISYLSPINFSYSLPQYKDDRGLFVEILKTHDSGQFSFLMIHPGVTRGSHYHHSKTEKFLVLNGRVRMRFRHLMSNETYEIEISSQQMKVVESVPGWVHDITNLGEADAYVMLWANEVFDRDNPDSISREVLVL